VPACGTLQVCVDAGPDSGSTVCNLGSFKVVRGDTCVRILAKYYRKNPTLFYWMNGERCQNRRLWLGRTLCLPL